MPPDRPRTLRCRQRIRTQSHAARPEVPYASQGPRSRRPRDGQRARRQDVQLPLAVQLVAAYGLGQRIAHETLSKQKIDSPELVYELVGLEMRRLRKESLRVILLDTRYHLIRVEEISVGSVNESIAHPRDVFRPALVSSAYAIIVVHNHPSGDASPSQTDHSLTGRLAEVAELLQIKLLDHIIIGAPSEANGGYFSFKEAGVL